MRIIDLSLTISDGMFSFPARWHSKVAISLMGKYEREGRETRRLVLGTHTGTHIDAPAHFIKGGVTVDKIPLTYLIGPAVVLDFSKRERNKILCEDFKSLLKKYENVERLLLRYDWSEKWGKEEYYKDYPFLSFEACKYLIEHGIKLIGMDTPSPDNPENKYGSENDSPNHKLLLGSGVIILEYLCNMKEITKEEVDVLILPLKIKESDGAPCRCVVIERE